MTAQRITRHAPLGRTQQPSDVRTSGSSSRHTPVNALRRKSPALHRQTQSCPANSAQRQGRRICWANTFETRRVRWWWERADGDDAHPRVVAPLSRAFTAPGVRMTGSRRAVRKCVSRVHRWDGRHRRHAVLPAFVLCCTFRPKTCLPVSLACFCTNGQND